MICDVFTGETLELPINLGKWGFQRREIRVRASDTNPPAPGGAWEAARLTGNRLTLRAGTETAQLVRLNSRGGRNTPDTRGSVSRVAGDAWLLARGDYAFGDDGCPGDGTDELWAVSGPAIWRVVRSGDPSKGYGAWYAYFDGRAWCTFPERECAAFLTAELATLLVGHQAPVALADAMRSQGYGAWYAHQWRASREGECAAYMTPELAARWSGNQVPTALTEAMRACAEVHA